MNEEVTPLKELIAEVEKETMTYAAMAERMGVHEAYARRLVETKAIEGEDILLLHDRPYVTVAFVNGLIAARDAKAQDKVAKTLQKAADAEAKAAAREQAKIEAAARAEALAAEKAAEAEAKAAAKATMEAAVGGEITVGKKGKKAKKATVAVEPTEGDVEATDPSPEDPDAF